MSNDLAVQPAIVIFDKGRAEACGVAPVGVADPTFFAPITKVQREAGGVRAMAINDAGQMVAPDGAVGGVPVVAEVNELTGGVSFILPNGVNRPLIPHISFFGAVPGEDCTLALQKWSASGGGELDISGADWYVATPEAVTLPTECHFIGDGRSSFIGPAAWPVPSNVDISKGCFYLSDGISLTTFGVRFKNFTHTFKARNGVPINVANIEFASTRWKNCYAAMSFTDNQRGARADIVVEYFGASDIYVEDCEYGFNVPSILKSANIGKHTFRRINRTHMVGGTIGNAHCFYLGTGYDSGAPFTSAQWDSIGPINITGGVIKQVKTFSTTTSSGSRDCIAYLVHGNKVKISDFVIDDMVGVTTGEGSEAIYTKARYVNIGPGVITDAGSGQASINIKGDPYGTATPATLGYDVHIHNVDIYGTISGRLCGGINVEPDRIKINDIRMIGMSSGYGLKLDAYDKDSVDLDSIEIELSSAGNGIQMERAPAYFKAHNIKIRARGITSGSITGLMCKLPAASTTVCKEFTIDGLTIDFDSSNTGLTDSQSICFSRHFQVDNFNINDLKSYNTSSATTVRHIRVTNEGGKTIGKLNVNRFSGPTQTSSNIAITGAGMGCTLTVKDSPAFVTRATGSFTNNTATKTISAIGLTSLSAISGIASSNLSAANVRLTYGSDPLGAGSLFAANLAATSFDANTTSTPSGTITVGWEVSREVLSIN